MSPGQEVKTARAAALDPATVFAALVPLVLVGGLVAYKSAASLAVIGKVQATGVLNPRFDLTHSASPTTLAGVLDRTWSYFAAVWPALAFGVLISGAVRAFVSPRWLAGLFRGGRVRAQLAAGLAGAPLMLCSCCVAPVFTSVYERSSRLAPSLALMLAAPALNPAALVLTFMLFGAGVGAARLVFSAALVVLAGLVAERFAGRAAPACGPGGGEAGPVGVRSAAAEFVRACAEVAVRTLPLIAGGVIVSMLLALWLPTSGLGPSTAGVVAVLVVALIAVPLAMPTFFELPLALLVVSAGMPPGAGLALMIAGPATNLPSLLTVARTAGWRAAALVAVSVWSLAAAAGLLAGLA